MKNIIVGYVLPLFLCGVGLIMFKFESLSFMVGLIFIALAFIIFTWNAFAKWNKKNKKLGNISASSENYNFKTKKIDNMKSKFTNHLSEDIAALKSSDNIQLDAYSILERKFDKQHAIYINLHNSLDATDRDRFSEAWQVYYGEDGEQEWQLPDMYSASSNQMKNTAENTKELAVDRIEKLLRLCR